MTITSLEKIILRKLVHGPLHARTFHLAKGVVRGLVQRGLVRRLAHNSDKRVYLELTRAGRDALGLAPLNMKRAVISVPEHSND